MISIFTTVTNPIKRGDNCLSALECFLELADEVIVIDGGAGVRYWLAPFGKYLNCKVISSEWPKEFDWPLIGRQFQKGYEACSGDWVIHADLDFIFHENDFEAVRKACEDNTEAPALSLWKYQFILPDRYNIKSRLVIAVNKGKFGDRIRFDSGGDLAQPSLDGQYIRPDDIPEARVPFYNYEKMAKTKEQIMEDSGRMERARFRHFGKYQFKDGDGTDQQAYRGWLEMAVGRSHKPQKHIKLDEHPKFMQETIKNLKPEQFGYNAFGNLEENNYVKNR